MNPKSVKCCMTTNIKKSKKKTSKKLARKRQTSRKQQSEKVRRFKWTEEDMEAAIGTVIGGSMSQRGSSETLGAPSNLAKIIKEKNIHWCKARKNPCLELS